MDKSVRFTVRTHPVRRDLDFDHHFFLEEKKKESRKSRTDISLGFELFFSYFLSHYYNYSSKTLKGSSMWLKSFRLNTSITSKCLQMTPLKRLRLPLDTRGKRKKEKKKTTQKFVAEINKENKNISGQ